MRKIQDVREIQEVRPDITSWNLACAPAFRLLLLGSAVLLAAACAGPKKIQAPAGIGGWLVYWDGERGLGELQAHGGLFHRVSLFAYELDPQGAPVAAPGMEELRPRFLELARSQGFAPWVTVVNDVRRPDGTAILKDTATLGRFLGDEELRRAHAARLAERAAAEGFAGLDLDYEGLDEAWGEGYQALVAELAGELGRRGLRLAVVLEPRRGPLPAAGSARLTVMGYNLHGAHSGPGPRATPGFVAGLGGRAVGDAAGTPALALALGGFAWSPGGRARPLDWAEGQELLRQVPRPERDPSSGTPHATLAGGEEIWLDDPWSLTAIWQAASAAGFRELMLWRLGGNDELLYRWVASLGEARKE